MDDLTAVDATTADDDTRRFWQDSLNDWWDLMGTPGDPDAGAGGPRGTRRHADRPRHPLPVEAAGARIGDLRHAFASFRSLPGAVAPGPAPRPTPSLLSALLHHTYGLTGMAMGPYASSHPYHRTVPSARGFFPTELYCWLPATGSIPAGLHVYDPLHHAVALIRPMEYAEARRALTAATGARLRDVRMALLLTSRFSRTAHHYNSYAYRLCAQEAGIVAGNALMAAGVLGLRGVLHHRLHDAALTSLLGISGAGESPAAVLTLHPWPATGASRPIARGAVPAPPRPAPPEDRGPGPDRRTCAALLDLDARSRRQAPRPVPLPAVRAATAPPGGSVHPLPPGPGPAMDATAALLDRSSGSSFGDPGGLPSGDVDLASITQALRYALDPHLSDLVPGGERPPVDCYLAAPAVADLPDGFYRWSPHTDSLHAQAPGPAARRLDALYRRAFGVPMWTFSPRHRSTNAVFYLAVDRTAGEGVLGERTYRTLHQEAGVVAQRLCVLCSAAGLAARVHNGYPAAAVGELLGLPAGMELVAQVIVGRSRPSGRYRMRLTP